MVDFVEYANREEQSAALADIVATSLRQRIDKDSQATLAVAGGSTPRNFLVQLGQKEVDWPCVTVLPTDERWLPPDHDRSNEAMLRETLLANGAAPQFFSFWRKGTSASDAAPGLTLDLDPHLPLDICVLGMGADMHCASLFPGGDTLPLAMAHGAPAVISLDAAGAPEPRITLTADVLAGGQLHLLITGDDKLDAYHAAMETSDALAAPVSGVIRRCKNTMVHWAP